MKSGDLESKSLRLAVAGLLAGAIGGQALAAPRAGANKPTPAPNDKNACAGPNGCGSSARKTDTGSDKHVCKGLNACKGKGGCKSGDAGCAAKNSCKGKGGCASADARHACKGLNSCKGMGGCKTGAGGCAGKNSCKGKGGCQVPRQEKAA